VTSIAIVWFRGKEVSFAFGTTVSASFIGNNNSYKKYFILFNDKR